uniref:hypothetical protein n=1 Tax=Castellaniella defragrans TaxID=75697 RepID=UPI00333FA6EC
MALGKLSGSALGIVKSEQTSGVDQGAIMLRDSLSHGFYRGRYYALRINMAQAQKNGLHAAPLVIRTPKLLCKPVST